MHWAPTGRCRAYPRKDVRFSPSLQTAGTECDPPPDWAVRHSAHEYGAAHLTAQSSFGMRGRTHSANAPARPGTITGAGRSPDPDDHAPPTRPHPREGRGMGNV
ncbi:hypothetical protein C3489_24490 [Streptomyces sp. Ru71]|nr:hypothetical protein C3489_24490 [Streptomyces sp. Ru71]